MGRTVEGEEREWEVVRVGGKGYRAGVVWRPGKEEWVGAEWTAKREERKGERTIASEIA